MTLVRTLLELGSDISHQGWMKIKSEWTFGSPIELAHKLQAEKDHIAWKELTNQLIKLLLDEQKVKFEKMPTQGKLIKLDQYWIKKSNKKGILLLLE